MVKLFSKSLQGIKGGGAPFCSALRGAVRNAKQKKTVPAKTAKRFLAVLVHMAPPGRQKSEREFCRSEGFFLRPMRRAACRGGRFCETCLCLACLARRAGVQGGAAARRLCVRLPAGAPSCGFVSVLRVLPLLRRLSCPLPCLPSVCFLARVYSFIFCPFLPHFCLSKIFSLVAQAATGLYFLPKRK